MRKFNTTKGKQSWAIIDCNGDEFVSASTILFEAMGDVARAKRIAIRDAKQMAENEVNCEFTIEKREV